MLDPLSVVLKKFTDRGSKRGKGYIGESLGAIAISCDGDRVCDVIGIYSPEDRKSRIERFLAKRRHRIWAKKVKYDVRKVGHARIHLVIINARYNSANRCHAYRVELC